MERRRGSLSIIFRCAREEYMKWLLQPRTIIAMVLAMFLHSLIIEPLQGAATLMNVKLGIWEPFIAAGTSSVVLLVVPLVFLTLISDFPVSDANTYFYILRVGKRNWLLGQVLFLIFAAGTFLAFLCLACIVPVLPIGAFTLRWSAVATHYSVRFPEFYNTFVDQLLPENLYNQMGVGMALVYTYTLMVLCFIWMGMIMLLTKLWGLKYVGLLLNGVLLTGGAALAMLQSPWMWYFPTANTVIWLHYDKYLRKPVKPVIVSYLYFIIFISILLVISWRAVKKYNYNAEQ